MLDLETETFEGLGGHSANLEAPGVILWGSWWLCAPPYSDRQLFHYNEDDFWIQFWCIPTTKLFNSMNTFKHKTLSREANNLKKSFSLIICKLVIRIKLSNNQIFRKKSRLHLYNRLPLYMMALRIYI